MSHYIYLCEDSIDGIFTAIYDAWADNHGHTNNEIQVATSDYNQQLFTEYIHVNTDIHKAASVARTMKQKISRYFYQQVMLVCSSYQLDKAQIIYYSTVLGLVSGAKVLEQQANPYINSLSKYALNATRENEHYRGFLRFEELRNGILLAKVRPKNDLLPFLAEHFTDRFSGENFIIADTGRNHVIVHPSNRPYQYLHMTELQLEQMTGAYSEQELWLKDLWKLFVTTISIDARSNSALQKQMLPLRFREYMQEMDQP